MDKLLKKLQELEVRIDFIKIVGSSVNISYLPGKDVSALIKFCEENNIDFCILDGLEITVNH